MPTWRIGGWRLENWLALTLPLPTAGHWLRHYAGPADIERWLEIRGIGRLLAKSWASGSGTPATSSREFFESRGGRPSGCGWPRWRRRTGVSQVVGTVTWADRGRPPEVKAAVHWLAVLPGYRRRGIGRLLLETLHQACWDAGHREIFLETHVAWAGAARLYQSLGYPACA